MSLGAGLKGCKVIRVKLNIEYINDLHKLILDTPTFSKIKEVSHYY